MHWVDGEAGSYYADGNGKIVGRATPQEDYFVAVMTTGENLGLFVDLASAKSAVESFAG